MRIVYSLIALAATQLVCLAHSFADPVKIGFIGSLSSFASHYGNEVLKGARLAVSELDERGINYELVIEDDQSIAKNTVSAYQKLRSVDGVRAIIGGSWWVNAIAKLAERDDLPLLSCETLFVKDTVLARTYFILPGDLREWIRVYEPLVEAQSWKRGAVIRYASGFGITLEEEFRRLFSADGREFLGTIEYNDIQATDAASIVLQLKRLDPEVVYIDAQPAGLANLLRKIVDLKVITPTFLTNAIVEDVKKDNLYDLSHVPHLYFTSRAAFREEFRSKYLRHTGEEPRLNADLGYYAVFLIHAALQHPDPTAYLKSGPEVEHVKFSFSEQNVERGIPQRIFKVEKGAFIPVSK